MEGLCDAKCNLLAIATFLVIDGNNCFQCSLLERMIRGCFLTLYVYLYTSDSIRTEKFHIQFCTSTTNWSLFLHDVRYQIVAVM